MFVIWRVSGSTGDMKPVTAITTEAEAIDRVDRLNNAMRVDGYDYAFEYHLATPDDLRKVGVATRRAA